MNETGRFMTMVIRLCFMLMTLMTGTIVSGQTFKGSVVDKNTGESLEYANIGVIGKAIGGISQRSGEFSIDLSRANGRDRVKISYIGYEPRSFRIDSLDFSRRHTIQLKPARIELRTVVVSEKANVVEFGNGKTGRRYTGWGDFKSLRGRTRGLLIEGLPCQAKVKALLFRINHNDWDSVAFRVNVLQTDGKTVGETLLRENIFLITTLKHKWLRIDLDHYNIAVCERVVVTLEWVDAWGKLEEYSNLLTISLSKVPGHIYVREPGEEYGILQRTDHAPAMVLEVYGE